MHEVNSSTFVDACKVYKDLNCYCFDALLLIWSKLTITEIENHNWNNTESYYE